MILYNFQNSFPERGLNQEEAVLVLSIDRYRNILRDISMEVHPFAIKTGGIKSSSNVYDGLL